MFHSISYTENTHWEDLPYVPLVLIFKSLENRDRFNASLACHNWYNAFECGSLWQNFTLIFHGDMTDDIRKAVKFVKKHASSLKYLSIQFRRNNMRLLQNDINSLKELFEHLKDSCQLHDFQLEDFFHPQQSSLNQTPNTRPAIDAFKAFVISQCDLKKFDFHNVRLSEVDALDVLTEIARKNKSLESLGLTHFFEGTVDALNNARFRNSIQKFQNLKEVIFSYECVSDDILAILCMSQGAALRRMVVTCDSREGLRHRIHPSSWSKLRQKYPDVKISFFVVEVVTQDQFHILLPQTIEIRSLRYSCGLSLQSEQNLRTHALPILQYLQQAFACFLRAITLEFGFVTIPHLDSAILDLLENCKWIESLYLSGVLKTELAVKVCEIALQEESELRSIFLMFYFTRIETIEEMNQLYDYHKLLKEKKIKFRFNLLTCHLPE